MTDAVHFTKDTAGCRTNSVSLVFPFTISMGLHSSWQKLILIIVCLTSVDLNSQIFPKIILILVRQQYLNFPLFKLSEKLQCVLELIIKNLSTISYSVPVTSF